MTELLHPIDSDLQNDNQGSLPVLGLPNSTKKSKSNVNKAFYLLGFLIAFLIIVISVMWFLKGRKKTVELQKSAKPTALLVQRNTAIESDLIAGKKIELKKNEIEKEVLEKESQEEEDRKQLIAAVEAGRVAQAKNSSTQNNAQPQQYQAQQYQGQQQNQKDRPPTATERKLSGSAIIDTSTKNDKIGTVNSRPYDTALAMNGNQSASSSGSDFGSGAGAGGGKNGIQGLTPTVLASRNAGKLRNLDYLLKKGSTIPCALKTGIDTQLAGFVICIVTNDVYSANGRTLLIERGSSIFGEQQSQLKQGMTRTFVLWTRIDNPNGVTANIDSPATDQMGFNGIEGYVDTHFFTRFGGAILMSLIKDFSQNLANTQNQTQPSYNNTSQGASDMATEALKNSINIPPTLVVNPATIVNVLVARDVSFESIYTLVK